MESQTRCRARHGGYSLASARRVMSQMLRDQGGAGRKPTIFPRVSPFSQQGRGNVAGKGTPGSGTGRAPEVKGAVQFTKVDWRGGMGGGMGGAGGQCLLLEGPAVNPGGSDLRARWEPQEAIELGAECLH